MPKVILTDARVKALRPRRTAYDIRDGKLKGFGVRVLPSGRKRYFVHCQHRIERVWKIVGDAATTNAVDARSHASGILAAIRRGESTPSRPGETCFEAVAETVFQRYQRVWKPGTLRANRSYLRSQLLPHFSGRPVADIDAREVRNWFASLRADTGRRRQVHAGAVRRHAGGGTDGLSARGVQPLPRHPAVPPEGTRAFPVR